MSEDRMSDDHTGMATDPRTRELHEALQRVEERIASACAAAGRPRSEVTLVVVTKHFPVQDILRLHALGVREIGENRVQELAGKLDELPGAVREDLTVHLIGQLQTNKARNAAGLADLVHTVDRSRLVPALDRGAEQRGRPLDVLLQVNLDLPAEATGSVAAGDLGGGGGRGGAWPDAVPALADEVAAATHLRLRGLMAVAPLGTEPGPAFARLAEVAAVVRAAHPEAEVLSAGMSGDLEAAVASGATHLRVGSAILGHRPAPR